jgi:hypothetical protein
MMLHRALLGIGLLAYGVIGVFFLWGLGDGTVSGFNAGSWLLLMAAPAGILWGGVALRRGGRPGLSNLLLAVLALPALCFFLVFLLLILANPRWN